MQTKEILTILTSVGLALNHVIISATVSLLDTIKQTGLDIDAITVIAAGALASETMMIPAVGSNQMVRTGLTLQMFLARLQQTQKYIFLQRVEVIMTIRQYSDVLRNKVKIVKICNQLFIKYKQIFRRLYEPQNNQEIMQCHFAIFWIVHLTQQKLFPTFNKEKRQIRLGNLLHCIFTKIIQNCNEAIVHQIIIQQIPSYRTHMANEQLQNIQSILAKAYQIRHEKSTHIDFELLRNDRIFLIRFVDDFSTAFERGQNNRTDMFVNQLTFLNLHHDLTPQTIRKSHKTSSPISQKIVFSDSQDQCKDQSESQDQNQNKPKPNRFTFGNVSNQQFNTHIEKKQIEECCEQENKKQCENGRKRTLQLAASECLKYLTASKSHKTYSKRNRLLLKKCIQKMKYQISKNDCKQSAIHQQLSKLFNTFKQQHEQQIDSKLNHSLQSLLRLLSL